VTCKQDDMFEATARTTFSMNLLPGRYSPLLGMVRLFNDGTNDIRGNILDGMCVPALCAFMLNSRFRNLAFVQPLRTWV
jgi:hypothetical protein